MRKNRFTLILAALVTMFFPLSAVSSDISRYDYVVDFPNECKGNVRSPKAGSIECTYQKGGRTFVLEVRIISDYFKDILPGYMEEIGKQSFWNSTVTQWERKALSKKPFRSMKVLDAALLGRAGPLVKGSKSCIRYRFDTTMRGTFIDNEGMRCLFYDARNDVIDMVVLQYEEARADSQRNPRFSREAKDFAFSLKRVPK